MTSKVDVPTTAEILKELSNRSIDDAVGRSVLTARLDRLGDARGVAQQAAVLGRRFRLDHLAALSPLGSEALSHSLEKLVAYMYIPEREFRQIGAGQPVQISVDAVPGPAAIAAVTRISPIVDPATGTFKITIEIGGNDQRLKPGMFGRMSIVYDKHENVLQIPRSAIIETTNTKYIFVVEDNVGIRKTIETGFSSSGMVEITSGLNGDESVITVGQIGLKNDANVVVINAPGEPDEPVESDEEAAE